MLIVSVVLMLGAFPEAEREIIQLPAVILGHGTVPHDILYAQATKKMRRVGVVSEAEGVVSDSSH